MGGTRAKILALSCALLLAALGCSKPSSVTANKATEEVAEKDGKSAKKSGDKAAANEPFVGGRSSAVVGGDDDTGPAVKVPTVGPKGSVGSTVGVTDTTIKIGFVIVNNNEKLLSNYGVRGGAIGDTRDQVNAVVDDVNDRGGIFGRKIVPVFRQLDATGDSDQYTQICTGFTQDDKVFAVLNPWNPDPGFAACLAKAGTFLVLDSLDQEDAETLDELHPYLISGLYSSSRAAIALANGLNKQGYFKGARLGIVRGSNPKWERVSKKYLRPTLASFGVKPVAEFAAGTSTINDAVLYMNDHDADHVLFLGARGGNPLFFMNAAQAQGYNPIYGLASPDGPAFLAQNAPYTQLRGAKAVGWWPGNDVLDSEGPPLTAAEQRCLDVHTKGGTDYGSRNEGAAVAMAFCDMMWLLEEAATAAGKGLGDASFVEGFEGLGTQHATTLTFGTSFGRNAYDGAYKYRSLSFDDSPNCRCFKYTGSVQTLPR